MRSTIELLRREPAARLFFAAHAQSSLGTGAAYVALVVVAYDRFRSPWAIALILLAEFLPGMVLGPLLGAAADRWSRRSCAVAADLVRAAAFMALPFVDSFAATVAVAALAGAGNALYRPATLAALPTLVAKSRYPAATALWGAFTDIGYTAGPALAALLLLLADADAVLAANGATFLLSAVVLTRIDFGRAPGGASPAAGVRRSLLREAGDGMRAAGARAGVRIIILASASVIVFAGLFNVGELLLAENELGAGSAGYSILVATYGAAVALGSLAGSRGGTSRELVRRYLGGLLLVGLGMLAAGFAPSFGVALAEFAVAGFGNGLLLVHERVLLQRTIPDGVLARVFGVKEMIESWAFAAAFIGGGVVASVLGTRELFIVAGGGGLVVFAIAAFALTRSLRADALEGPHLPEGGVPGADLAEPDRVPV